MREELKVLFPLTNLELAYNNSNLIKIDVSPVVVIFGNLEYNEIMNANFYNLGYDDGLDSLFNETFWKNEEILTQVDDGDSSLVEVGTR